MTVRPKILWRLVLLATLLYGMAHYYVEFDGNGWGTKEWLIVAMSPLAIFGVVFIAQTIRITLSDETIQIYWYVGVPGMKLWVNGPDTFSWRDVNHVFLLFPTWIPIEMVGVNCKSNNKSRTFFLGSYMTNKKASMVYLGDHADAGVIDDDVRRLIDRHKRTFRPRAEQDRQV